MDQYVLVILLIGLSSLGMAFMPAISKRTGISYSLIYVAVGAIVYLLLPDFLPSPVPDQNRKLTLHVTELIVIISLMGTGIKIDREFSWRSWKTPLKLISITMILCIALASLLGMIMLHLALPAAVLLGAVLAPTDPVLASDVQVGPPNEKVKSETKFALTSEAGLNDGMAFPFTWLAIILCLGTADQNESLLNWLSYYLIYKVLAGLLLGYFMGKLTAYLVFTVSEKYKLIKPTDGFLAISLTLCVYGVTEALYGYGFLAVFVSALSLRHAEKTHKYHDELHAFTDQIERLLLGVLLIFFGGSLVSGILEPLNWQIVLFSLIFLLIIRPITAYLPLLSSEMHWKERLAISFFGIRGMGSIFYLAFAFGHAHFGSEKEIWTIVAFTILLSILMHGLTATPIMNHLKINIPKSEIPQP